MKRFRAAGGKLLLAVSMCAMMALSLASTASAAVELDAEDFTKPLETQLGTVVPIVVGFLAVVFGIGFLIRWIMSKVRSAR